MKQIVLVVFAGAIAIVPPSRAADQAQVSTTRLEKLYAIDGDDQSVRVTRISDQLYVLYGPDWEGVGIVEGATYRGVFHVRGAASGDIGEQVMDLSAAGLPRVTQTPRGGSVVRQQWRAFRPKPAQPPSAPPDTSSEAISSQRDTSDVPVDAIAVVTKKAMPEYPDIAREAGVNGTVMIKTLIDSTGVAVDALVVKSIPMLDAAAIACVRKWLFTPAQKNGRPVASWLTLPVKF